MAMNMVFVFIGLVVVLNGAIAGLLLAFVVKDALDHLKTLRPSRSVSSIETLVAPPH
ncbi:hypothetical protein BH09ACT10_BH09ACT10_23740 [soil metagenome]